MLLALMAGIVVGIQIEGTRWNKARYSKTRFQIAELQVALERYRADYGYYPTTDQGLSALGEYYSDGPWQFEPPEIDPDGLPATTLCGSASDRCLGQFLLL
jgi:general secretion pathway protein G